MWGLLLVFDTFYNVFDLVMKYFTFFIWETHHRGLTFYFLPWKVPSREGSFSFSLPLGFGLVFYMVRSKPTGIRREFSRRQNCNLCLRRTRSECLTWTDELRKIRHKECFFISFYRWGRLQQEAMQKKNINFKVSLFHYVIDYEVK